MISFEGASHERGKRRPSVSKVDDLCEQQICAHLRYKNPFTLIANESLGDIALTDAATARGALYKSL